jgi:hypothetical protein
MALDIDFYITIFAKLNKDNNKHFYSHTVSLCHKFKKKKTCLGASGSLSLQRFSDNISWGHSRSEALLGMAIQFQNGPLTWLTEEVSVPLWLLAGVPLSLPCKPLYRAINMYLWNGSWLFPRASDPARQGRQLSLFHMVSFPQYSWLQRSFLNSGEEDSIMVELLGPILDPDYYTHMNFILLYLAPRFTNLNYWTT